MAMDLTRLDLYVADKLFTTEFVGGLLLSLLFLLAVVIAVSLITRNNNVLTLSGVVVILFCTGIQWLPVWVAILIAMLVSLFYGNLATKVMGG